MVSEAKEGMGKRPLCRELCSAQASARFWFCLLRSSFQSFADGRASGSPMVTVAQHCGLVAYLTISQNDEASTTAGTPEFQP